MLMLFCIGYWYWHMQDGFSEETALVAFNEAIKFRKLQEEKDR